MEGQCESKLLITDGIDEFVCSLLEGHVGPHLESDTVPPYYDKDEVDGSVINDPEVRWSLTWW